MRFERPLVACALLFSPGSALASPKENLEAVKRIHAATTYSKVLLASGILSPDVEWQAAGPKSLLPWAGSWKGINGVKSFFETLNAKMDYQGFATEEFLVDGDEIVTIISAHGRAIPTGKLFESTIVRIYTFKADKVVRVRNFYDTYEYVRSLQGAK